MTAGVAEAFKEAKTAFQAFIVEPDALARRDLAVTVERLAAAIRD